MSLINDALKRTKQAQQQTPPAAGGPELKAIDPAAARAAGSSKTLLYIMVACVIAGNAFIFLYYFANEHGSKRPAASSVVTPDIKTNAVATRVSTPAVQAAPPSPPAPAPVSVDVPAANSPVSVDTNAAAVAAVVSVAPEPPKPAPLKLQSIIFNPSRPSAMISGKFVFIGDKVQGFRVSAIDQESVTLMGNGQTNVLSLP